MRVQFAIGILACAACQPPDATPEMDAPELPGSNFEAPAFEFEQVAEDVYHARGTGNLAVGSNAAIIVNDDDVLVVDSHVSPAAAAALVNELQSITDKPVRYVINTHFHFDHAHGNQIYPANVEIIGHEFTREMIANGGSLGRTYERWQDYFSSQPGYIESQKNLVPTPPNTTLSERMTLFRGNREIRLLFFGRGHTGGDVVVHLPAERVLITGDLLLEFFPSITIDDGFPLEWVETLESLKALDFDVIVPGHDQTFSDRSKIDHFQNLLRSYWERASETCSRGLSASQAAEQIDLSDHSANYPSITGPGVPFGAVERIYELIPCEGVND